MITGKVIAIDFDGTITKKNDFPNIGEFRPNVKEAIEEIQKAGNICFLWTCRQGKYLISAIKSLERAGIKLYGYNSSPYDITVTCGRKPIADYYIDDRNIFTEEIDWLKIRDFFCGE